MPSLEDENSGPPPDWFVAASNPVDEPDEEVIVRSQPMPERSSDHGRSSNKSRYDRKKKTTRTVELDENGEPKPLTPKQLERLEQRAMNVVLWHLEQSAKTRKELTDKLVRKEIPADIIEKVLAKVEEMGFINDAQYADNFVRSRVDYRKLGKRRISMELRRKGVDQELVAEALEEVDEDTERDNARELVEKRMRSTQGLDRQKRTQRLVGMLARRGYNGGMAYQVVREALDAEGDLEDEDFEPR